MQIPVKRIHRCVMSRTNLLKDFWFFCASRLSLLTHASTPAAAAIAPGSCGMADSVCSDTTSAGSYPSKTGLSAPSRCPGGHFCPGGGAVPAVCAAGFYCPPGASAPKLCPAGMHCQAGVTAPSPCQDCSVNHYRGMCGKSAAYPDGPCWKCSPCNSGKIRVGCGGGSPGTCVKMDWTPV